VGNALVDRTWNFRSTCLRTPVSARTLGYTIPEFVSDDYVWDAQCIRGNRCVIRPPINSDGTSVYQRDINSSGEPGVESAPHVNW
jgi:hypothetical protein